MLSTGAGERLTSTQPVQLDISAVVRFERAIHLSGPVVAGPQDVVLRSCPSTPDVVVGPVRWIAPPRLTSPLADRLVDVAVIPHLPVQVIPHPREWGSPRAP